MTPRREDVDSVRRWIEAWGAEVAAADLRSGRRRFAADVVGFGTHADVVRGLAELEERQWSRIWPAIEGFRFRVEDVRDEDVHVSADRTLAVAAVLWDSTGVAQDGSTFDRPGRATIVLRRESPDHPWVGVHTHFSLARGVPASTHGRRAPIR